MTVVGYFNMTKKEFEYWKKHSSSFYNASVIYVSLHKPMLLHNVYGCELRYEDEVSNLFVPDKVINISFDNDAITFVTRVGDYYFDWESRTVQSYLIGDSLVNVIPRKNIKSIEL